jgi:hypothetical protein
MHIQRGGDFLPLINATGAHQQLYMKCSIVVSADEYQKLFNQCLSHNFYLQFPARRFVTPFPLQERYDLALAIDLANLIQAALPDWPEGRLARSPALRTTAKAYREQQRIFEAALDHLAE